MFYRSEETTTSSNTDTPTIFTSTHQIYTITHTGLHTTTTSYKKLQWVLPISNETQQVQPGQSRTTTRGTGGKFHNWTCMITIYNMRWLQNTTMHKWVFHGHFTSLVLWHFSESVFNFSKWKAAKPCVFVAVFSLSYILFFSFNWLKYS